MSASVSIHRFYWINYLCAVKIIIALKHNSTVQNIRQNAYINIILTSLIIVYECNNVCMCLCCEAISYLSNYCMRYFSLHVACDFSSVYQRKKWVSQTHSLPHTKIFVTFFEKLKFHTRKNEFEYNMTKLQSSKIFDSVCMCHRCNTYHHHYHILYTALPSWHNLCH